MILKCDIFMGNRLARCGGSYIILEVWEWKQYDHGFRSTVRYIVILMLV